MAEIDEHPLALSQSFHTQRTAARRLGPLDDPCSAVALAPGAWTARWRWTITSVMSVMLVDVEHGDALRLAILQGAGDEVSQCFGESTGMEHSLA